MPYKFCRYRYTNLYKLYTKYLYKNNGKIQYWDAGETRTYPSMQYNTRY